MNKQTPKDSDINEPAHGINLDQLLGKLCSYIDDTYCNNVRCQNCTINDIGIERNYNGT